MKQQQSGLFRALFLLLFVMSGRTATAQTAIDTLKYSLQVSEGIFLEHNLPLLAEKLNISQADARILQAKTWPNPTFTLNDIQLYNNASTDESPPLFGNFWRNRTFGASIEQLVYTAGKRKKNIALETRNKELAESTFTDLLQALKAEFRQTGAEMLYLQSVLDDWAFQLSEVNKLLQAQHSQFREGNISQSELFRLKALQISLQGDLNERYEQMTEKQKSIKILMNVKPESYLIMTDNPAEAEAAIAKLKTHSLNELIARSGNHNAALNAARKETQVNEAQFRIQRANRVPDVKLSLGYDRNGNNQLNFLGAGFSVDLPFFDRNKGNIRAAQLEVQKSSLMEQNKEVEVSNAVVKNWTDLNRAIQLYESIDKDYVDQLQGMTTAIIKNFVRHNISLLEFLDFFDSFKESKQKYYEAIRNISIKKEELNYLTGSEL